jgi:hypothetical protein
MTLDSKLEYVVHGFQADGEELLFVAPCNLSNEEALEMTNSDYSVAGIVGCWHVTDEHWDKVVESIGLYEVNKETVCLSLSVQSR